MDWDYAINMARVDGAEPSKEFLELVEQEKRGEISTTDMLRILKEHQTTKGKEYD